MSRELAVFLLGAIVIAEIGLRIAQLWEQIGRAVTWSCPCGSDCR